MAIRVQYGDVGALAGLAQQAGIAKARTEEQERRDRFLMQQQNQEHQLKTMLLAHEIERKDKAMDAVAELRKLDLAREWEIEKFNRQKEWEVERGLALQKMEFEKKQARKLQEEQELEAQLKQLEKDNRLTDTEKEDIRKKLIYGYQAKQSKPDPWSMLFDEGQSQEGGVGQATSQPQNGPVSMDLGPGITQADVPVLKELGVQPSPLSTVMYDPETLESREVNNALVPYWESQGAIKSSPTEDVEINPVESQERLSEAMLKQETLERSFAKSPSSKKAEELKMAREEAKRMRLISGVDEETLRKTQDWSKFQAKYGKELGLIRRRQKLSARIERLNIASLGEHYAVPKLKEEIGKITEELEQLRMKRIEKKREELGDEG